MTIISSTKNLTSSAFKKSPDLHNEQLLTNRPSYDMDKLLAQLEGAK
jgi:hypothetical protein